MNRRKVFPLLGSLALAWPTVLRAQQPPDRRQAAQVAYLGTGLVGWRVDALRAGLRSEGFEEGRNLVLHVRTTADRYDLLRAAAEDVVRLGVDVIAARGDTAARAARAATSTIPIVVIGSSNPVAAGWAVSLARPGGNVTGVLNYGNELFPKRLELLAEAVPGVTDVGVMYSSGSVSQVASIRIAQEAAVRMGLRLVIREVNRAEDIEPALDAIASVGARAIAPAQSTLLANHVEQIAEGARRHALAGIFSDRSYVDAGRSRRQSPCDRRTDRVDSGHTAVRQGRADSTTASIRATKTEHGGPCRGRRPARWRARNLTLWQSWHSSPAVRVQLLR